jgi:5-carboxymethyl-2-hydroxymuconate isomerase
VETLAHHATTLAPEYGTLVPMRYMNADQHFKVISVSALCTVHYLNDSARLGWALRRAVEEHYDGTGGLPGQRQLSHRFAQNGLAPEYAFKIWSPFLEMLDHQVVQHVAARRLEGLLRDAARVRQQGPRRRLHARHRHAAGRAGLVGLRRAGRGRHAVLRRQGTGQINASSRSRRRTGMPCPGVPVASAPRVTRPSAGSEPGPAMPHLVILYTGNLDAMTDMPALCRTLCDAMLTVTRRSRQAQVYPTGGTRVLAYPAAHWAVADGGAAGRGRRRQRRLRFHVPEHAHGQGPQRRRQAAGRQGRAGRLKAHVAPLIEREHVGFTLQIDEGHEVFDAKHSNLHPLFNKP